MKNFYKFKKNTDFLRNIGKKATRCWSCHQQVVFVIAVLIAAAAGAYFWWISLYRSDWSSEEKRQYLLTQEREINLKENDFKKMIEERDKRKKDFEAETDSARDIFKPY